MRKILIFVLILFLTSCTSEEEKQKEKQDLYSGQLQILSQEDVFYNWNGIKEIKANIIETKNELRINSSYNITFWNENSYQTTMECSTKEICRVKLDKKGTMILNKINENSFSITEEGDVRNPYWCIAYKEMVYHGATEEPRYFKDDKTEYFFQNGNLSRYIGVVQVSYSKGKIVSVVDEKGKSHTCENGCTDEKYQIKVPSRKIGDYDKTKYDDCQWYHGGTVTLDIKGSGSYDLYISQRNV